MNMMRTMSPDPPSSSPLQVNPRLATSPLSHSLECLLALVLLGYHQAATQVQNTLQTQLQQKTAVGLTCNNTALAFISSAKVEDNTVVGVCIENEFSSSRNSPNDARCATTNARNASGNARNASRVNILIQGYFKKISPTST